MSTSTCPVVFILVLCCSSLWNTVNGYRFDCLTSTCLCDTDDEVIHCHNARLETVPLPENRLRGFLFLGMTGNRIRNLPSEQTLLNKFPDLKVIDVENNHGVFDCESLAQYNKIKVLTDCGKEDGVSSIVTGLTVPDVDEPTAECDLGCQVKRHYIKLHQYMLKLWQEIKRRWNQFDRDQVLQDVQDFFVRMIQKINNPHRTTRATQK